jgi:hypothetical protein
MKRIKKGFCDAVTEQGRRQLTGHIAAIAAAVATQQAGGG